MNHRFHYLVLALGVLCAAVVTMSEDGPRRSNQTLLAAEEQTAPPRNRENDPQSVVEARGRARLLYEAMHGALQVMHRDFFREGEKLTIPSESLDDVFAELMRTYGVKARWLAVDTPAMNIDHKPADDFEKNAVKALKDGKKEFESVENGSFRYAGPITLSATCLGCHAPLKSNTKDRAAGLVITLPLAGK